MAAHFPSTYLPPGTEPSVPFGTSTSRYLQSYSLSIAGSPTTDVLFTSISPFFSPAAILVSQNTSVSAYVHDVMTGKETKLDAAGGAAAGAEGSVATGAGI